MRFLCLLITQVTWWKLAVYCLGVDGEKEYVGEEEESSKKKKEKMEGNKDFFWQTENENWTEEINKEEKCQQKQKE